MVWSRVKLQRSTSNTLQQERERHSGYDTANYIDEENTVHEAVSRALRARGPDKTLSPIQKARHTPRFFCALIFVLD